MKGGYERRDVWPGLKLAMKALKRRPNKEMGSSHSVVACFGAPVWRYIVLRKEAEIWHQTTSWSNLRRNTIQWCYPCLQSRSGNCDVSRRRWSSHTSGTISEQGSTGASCLWYLQSPVRPLCLIFNLAVNMRLAKLGVGHLRHIAFIPYLDSRRGA